MENVIACPRLPRFVNVGEDPPHPLPGTNWIGRRQWQACLEYGFLSAGQGQFYSNPLKKLLVGDMVAAYITGYGYVGLGKVLATAIPIRNFLFNGGSLKSMPYIRDSLFDNSQIGNPKSEYIVAIKWEKHVNKDNAKWETNAGLFASRLVQCSMENQADTIDFLEKEFEIKFSIV